MKTPENQAKSVYSNRGFSTSAAAVYLGLSESFLQKARVNLTDIPGPEFKKIGRRCLYTREALDAYLDNPPSK